MVKVESRASRGELEKSAGGFVGYGIYTFGKKEFGVKCETEISDMRFPRDDSVLEWCWGSRMASVL